MKFEFEGMDELIQKMDQLGIDIKRDKNDAVLEGAKVMQKATQEKAPKKTGNLSNLIEISDVEDGSVDVFVDQQGKAYYGYFLEYGTSKMRAQPFMGPAFNANMSKIQDAMASKMREKLMAL